MEFEILKLLHILSFAILFGTGLGTAFHGWFGYVSNDSKVVAVTMGNVVLADFLFTIPTGFFQPISGIMLINMAGYAFNEPWIMVSFGLYFLTFMCWLPVVFIQVKVRNLARQAAFDSEPLPDQCRTLMRVWFTLGWPAFFAFLGIAFLMVVKPELW